MVTKKLLICDDDIDIIEMLELVLEDKQIEIITEIDSRKMIDLMIDTNPDLVLMDLWMPIITGDELLAQIRDNTQLGNIPVMIMSAALDGMDIAINAGANDYIAKPFDMDELLSKVHELIGFN